MSWNTRALLSACLLAVEQAALAAAPLAVEVIVVDNGSTDGSIELVRECFPAVRLITNHQNAGFAAANNRGIAEATGSAVLLLNSDAFVTRDALSVMACFLNDRPRAGAVGCHLLYPDGSFQLSHTHFPSFLSELSLMLGPMQRIVGPYASGPISARFRRPRTVDWISGAAIFARRAALTAIGGFDTGFFMFSEETDLCRRLWQAGWQVWYAPAITVFHVGGGSTRQRRATNYAQLYRSKVRYFRLAYGPAAAERLRRSLLLLARARLGLWGTMAETRRLGLITQDQVERLMQRREQDRAVVEALRTAYG